MTPRAALMLVLALLLPGCAMLSQKAAHVECGSGSQPWLLLVTETPGYTSPDNLPMNIERIDRSGDFLVVRGTYNAEVGNAFDSPPLGYQNTTEAAARALVTEGLGKFPANATMRLAYAGHLTPDQMERACAGIAGVVVAMLGETKDVNIADCGGHDIVASLADGDHRVNLNCQGEGPVSRAAYGELKKLEDLLRPS